MDAFDNDLESVRVAKINARANQVDRAIRLRRGDVTRMPLVGREYALVCANLIAPLLMRQRRRIAARVAPGGLLVVAGVLRTEFRDVRRAYEATGLRLEACRAEKEWQSGAFRRPAGPPRLMSGQAPRTSRGKMGRGRG